MTSLAGVEDLGVRASIADAEALGGSASLEDVLKVEAETSLAESPLTEIVRLNPPLVNHLEVSLTSYMKAVYPFSGRAHYKHVCTTSNAEK